MTAAFPSDEVVETGKYHRPSFLYLLSLLVDIFVHKVTENYWCKIFQLRRTEPVIMTQFLFSITSVRKSINITSMILALEEVKAETYFSHLYDTIFFTLDIVHREENKSDTKKNMYK